MKNFMLYTLHNKLLWNFKALNINYPFVLTLSIILYYASDFKEYFIFKK